MNPNSSVELPDLAFARILSYSSKQTLLSAREVCHQWNDIALSLFPTTVTIDIEKWELKRNEEGGAFYRSFEPRIFSRINYNGFDCFKRSDGDGTRMSLLQAAGITQNIVYLSVNSSEALEALAEAVNVYGFPNLKELHTMQYPAREDYIFTTQFLPNSLPKLEYLKACCIPSQFRHPSSQLFAQGTIEAAPNVKSLHVNDCHNLSGLRGLERLTLMFAPDGRDRLYSMLEDVEDTLVFLSITGLKAGGPLPILRKLKEFQLLQIKLSRSTPLRAHIPNLPNALPNLRTLKTENSGAQDEAIITYLASRPQALAVLEVRCCNGVELEPKHAWICSVLLSLLAQIPNLRVLKIFNQCSFDLGRNSDIIQAATKLEFNGELIVSFGFAVKWFRDLLKFTDQMKVAYKENSRGTITFCGDTESKDVLKIEEDMARNFPVLIMKLRKRWDRIIVKHLKVPEATLKIVKTDIKKYNLPVDLYHSTDVQDPAT